MIKIATKVTVDDGVEINYQLDDFTNPWEEVTETIALHHGSTQNLKFYTPMVPALARKYRVLRWDARGRGGSTAPPPGSTFSGAPVDDGVTVGERYVKDALCLMDNLGIEKIHWVGDSCAGIIGAYFAVRYPDRIKSLVSITAPLTGLPREFTLACSLGEKDVATAIEKWGLRGWLARTNLMSWNADRSEREARWVSWQRAERKKIHTHAYAGHWRWQEKVDLTPMLGKIKVPTLILAAARSRICPLEQQYSIQKQIPNAKIIVYEDVGHGVQFLMPERVAEDILKFLETVD